jgi:hypothetical protein
MHSSHTNTPAKWLRCSVSVLWRNQIRDLMTIRKGEVTYRRIAREFPHQVAIRIPPGGLGMRSMEMHEFCKERGPHHTKSDRRRDLGDFTRFCFADRAHADAFEAKFGGERIEVKPSKRKVGGPAPRRPD